LTEARRITVEEIPPTQPVLLERTSSGHLYYVPARFRATVNEPALGGVTAHLVIVTMPPRKPRVQELSLEASRESGWEISGSILRTWNMPTAVNEAVKKIRKRGRKVRPSDVRGQAIPAGAFVTEKDVDHSKGGPEGRVLVDDQTEIYVSGRETKLPPRVIEAARLYTSSEAPAHGRLEWVQQRMGVASKQTAANYITRARKVGLIADKPRAYTPTDRTPPVRYQHPGIPRAAKDVARRVQPRTRGKDSST